MNIPREEHQKGSIREMAVIALPMVVSSACDTVMIFTDRLFLSKLGPELMNAAMGGGLTVFMMMSFFIGVIGYATALVASPSGRRRSGAHHCVHEWPGEPLAGVCPLGAVEAHRSPLGWTRLLS